MSANTAAMVTAPHCHGYICASSACVFFCCFCTDIQQEPAGQQLALSQWSGCVWSVKHWSIGVKPTPQDGWHDIHIPSLSVIWGTLQTLSSFPLLHIHTHTYIYKHMWIDTHTHTHTHTHKFRYSFCEVTLHCRGIWNFISNIHNLIKDKQHQKTHGKAASVVCKSSQ